MENLLVVLSFPSPLMMSTRPRISPPNQGRVKSMIVLPARVLQRKNERGNVSTCNYDHMGSEEKDHLAHLKSCLVLDEIHVNGASLIHQYYFVHYWCQLEKCQRYCKHSAIFVCTTHTGGGVWFYTSHCHRLKATNVAENLSAFMGNIL